MENKPKNVDELINTMLNKMTNNKSLNYASIGDNDNDFQAFKYRYKWFKQYLKEQFTDYDIDTILMMYHNYYKIGEIISVHNSDLFVSVLNEELKLDK